VSDLPAIAEPLFQKLNARVEFEPLMTGPALKSGLGKLH